MNKKLLLVFIIVIFICFFIINSSQIQADCIGATTNFTCGDTISESCTLNQSETTSIHCFDVNVDDIIINCDGFTISSSSTNINLIKISQHDNITIENCNLSGGEKAIYLDRSINSTIKNTILLSGAYPFLLEYSNYTNITNITLPSNPGDNAQCIYFFESNNNNLSYSTISCESTSETMYLVDSNNNILFNNTFKDAVSDCISIEGNENTIRKNTIINNDGKGVIIWSGSNNLIYNNTITNNDATGVVIWSGAQSNNLEYNNISLNNNGIYVYRSDNNTIYNNIANNGSYGIKLFEANHNNITNNIANNNTYGIQLMDPSNNNNITNNTVNDNNQGISIMFSSINNTVINNTANSNNQYGIYVDDSDSNTIYNNNASSNDQYGIYIVDSSNNNITNNTVKENLYYDIYIGTTSSLDCNNIIQSNTGSGDREIKYYNSSTSLSDETLSELILCNANSSAIDNITINGSTSLGNNALLVLHTNNSNFTNMNSSHNYHGIYFRNSFNNNLTNNTVNSNNQSGIYLEASSNSLLINNILNSNTYGVYFKAIPGEDSKSNVVKSSLVTQNDYNIYFYDSSTGGGSCVNNTIWNTVANNSNTYDIVSNLTGNGAYLNNTLLNVTFNKTNINVSSSYSLTNVIYIKWYVDVYVNYTNATPVNGANVTIKDTNNNLINWSLTNSSGYIERQNITEFYKNITGNFFLTNYTINASKNPSNSTEVNLTGNRIESNKIVLTLGPAAAAEQCSDGTAYGACSTNLPLYCDSGTLIQRCNLCGCPSGYTCQDDTDDDTYDTCQKDSGGGGGGGGIIIDEPYCGDGVCDPEEDYENCNEDCCAPEGAAVRQPFNCCYPLIAVDPFTPSPISIKYCILCGDGFCKEHENYINCPQDCDPCNFHIPIKIRFVR